MNTEQLSQITTSLIDIFDKCKKQYDADQEIDEPQLYMYIVQALKLPTDPAGSGFITDRILELIRYNDIFMKFGIEFHENLAIDYHYFGDTIQITPGMMEAEYIH